MAMYRGELMVNGTGLYFEFYSAEDDLTEDQVFDFAWDQIKSDLDYAKMGVWACD